MANAKVIRTIIGIIGNVLSTLISLSEMPVFIQIYKTKSEEDYLPCGQVLLWLKHGLWILYGLPRVSKDNILVITSNGVGLALQVIYVAVYLIYTPTRKCTLLSLLYVLLFVAFVYVTGVFGVETFSIRHLLIGVLCNYITTTTDAIFLLDVPVWVSLAVFTNAGVWIAFSSISNVDIYLLISNGLGLLMCAFGFLCRNVGQHSTPPTVNVVAV